MPVSCPTMFLLQVLRDVFSFKPPITKEQFFSNGFVERKIIMCVDVIGLIRNQNKLLRPKTAKTQPRQNQSIIKLGPRVLWIMITIIFFSISLTLMTYKMVICWFLAYHLSNIFVLSFIKYCYLKTCQDWWAQRCH